MENVMIDPQMVQTAVEAANIYALQHAWVGMAIMGYLVFHKIITGIRDAIDKTPDTDDTPFERFVTISKKVAKFLGAGARPKQNP